MQTQPIIFADAEWTLPLWPDQPDLPAGDSYPYLLTQCKCHFLREALLGITPLPPQQVFSLWLFN